MGNTVPSRYPSCKVPDGCLDGVWDDRDWTVAGKKLTLNEIEHTILRQEFAEPRIHVAINCASNGCPPLLDVPYHADRLDSLLTVSSRRFATSDTHNRIDPVRKIARLSSIFDWFGDDFVNRYYVADKYSGLDEKKSAALNFIVSHLPESTAVVADSTHSVEYMEYDWTLNDLSR